nr:MAG TPA: hypothetical protein [Caudoviricetes sp.]
MPLGMFFFQEYNEFLPIPIFSSKSFTEIPCFAQSNFNLSNAVILMILQNRYDPS